MRVCSCASHPLTLPQLRLSAPAVQPTASAAVPCGGQLPPPAAACVPPQPLASDPACKDVCGVGVMIIMYVSRT